MKQNLTISIPTDGEWDFVHRFRNFGEEVYLRLRATCSVDINEIDEATEAFSVCDIPDDKLAEINATIHEIAMQHFFAERVIVTTKQAEPTAPAEAGAGRIEGVGK